MSVDQSTLWRLILKSFSEKSFWQCELDWNNSSRGLLGCVMPSSSRRWRQYGPPKCWYPSTTLRGVTTHKNSNLHRSENLKFRMNWTISVKCEIWCWRRPTLRCMRTGYQFNKNIGGTQIIPAYHADRRFPEYSYRVSVYHLSGNKVGRFASVRQKRQILRLSVTYAMMSFWIFYIFLCNLSGEEEPSISLVTLSRGTMIGW